MHDDREVGVLKLVLRGIGQQRRSLFLQFRGKAGKGKIGPEKVCVVSVTIGEVAT